MTPFRPKEQAGVNALTNEDSARVAIVGGDVAGNLDVQAHTKDASIHSSGGGGSVITYHVSSPIPSLPTPNEFLSPEDNGTNSIESRTQQVMPRAGTMKNLTVFVAFNSRSDSSVVTVRKNGVDTLLSVTILTLSTAIVVNAVDTVAFAATDRLSVRIDTNAGAGNLGPGFSCTMEYV